MKPRGMSDDEFRCPQPILLISSHRGRANSLPRLLEISQVRRRLAFAGRHQIAIAAAIIGLLPDPDQLVVAGAVIFEPFRILGRQTAIGLRHRPRARVGIVDQGDVVAHGIRLGPIEDEALSDYRLVVGVDRHAGRVERARAFEMAGLHLKYVEASLTFFVDPFADRITEEARLDILRPVAPAAHVPTAWSDRTRAGRRHPEYAHRSTGPTDPGISCRRKPAR